MNQFSRIVDKILCENANYFITGGAGTGKSLLINELTTRVKENGKTVLLTASTGLASTHINGQTIHSIIYRINDYLEQIAVADYIIIDEISMINKDLFGRVINSIKAINENIQIIVVGDFFQLPPVRNHDEFNYSFAFESPEWLKADFKVILLGKSLRQNGDRRFAENLELIRTGDKKGIQYINKNKNNNYIEGAVAICDRTKNAEIINSNEFQKIKGESKCYCAFNVDKVKAPKGHYKKDLYLKIGCQVMLTVNDLDGEYVNGTIGTIVKLDDDLVTVGIKDKLIDVQRHSFYEVDDKGRDIIVEQFPIVLAYAITIHKSQGLSLEEVNIIYDYFWESGQLYTALSRCKSVKKIFIGSLNITENGLFITNKDISSNDIKINQKVIDFYNSVNKERNAA